MKSVYSAGANQKVIANDVQNPFKDVITSLAGTRTGFHRLYKAYKELTNLDAPTKENTDDTNAHILIDIRDELFRHINNEDDKKFWGKYNYAAIFRTLIDYGIGKYAYDNFFKGISDWWFGEMLRRGWVFPGYNRPNSQLWHKLTPATQTRLEKSIKDNYELLNLRLKTISETMEPNSEESNKHKASRFQQFIDRILKDMELEVESWRR